MNMFFEQELYALGYNLPNFTADVPVDIEQKNGKEHLNLLLYSCHVCGSRFEHITSFIKSCSGHVLELPTADEFDSEVPPPIKLLIKKENVIPFENGDSDEKVNESDDEYLPSKRKSTRLKGKRSRVVEDDDESEEESDSEDEDLVVKRSGSSKKSKVKKLKAPEGMALCCPICTKSFTRRQFYRDHMDCHENPLLKCCQLCATEFSNGINAKKHKKKFHPDLYQMEIEERKEQRKHEGKRKFPTPVYKKLDKIKKEQKLVGLKTEKHSIRITQKSVGLKVALERIFLPGFLENNWVFLPKNGAPYPWVLPKRVKVEPDVSSLLNTTILKKEELEEDDGNTADDYVKCEPDFQDYDDDFPDSPIKSEVSMEPVKTTEALPKRSWSKVENTQYPQFPGATYIFDVYTDKRNAQSKELRKKRRENKEKGKLLPPLPKTSKDANAPKKHWTHYRPDPKTCLICGAVRSNSNLRRHVAKHCLEEEDLNCRVCECEFTASNKLKEHYLRAHKVKFREHLYNITKERIETNQQENSSQLKYHTCHVCYTNMKTEDDLRYHIEMLHNYTGGKPRGTLNCDLCEKTFATVQNRNLHMRKIHGKILDGSVFCNYCGKAFLGKGYLISHFRAVHFDANGDFKTKMYKEKKRYKKPSKKVLGDSNKLAEHFEKYKVHSVCEVCGIIKESRFALMRHRYTKHDILDPGYSKALERDRQNHNCQYCGKLFTSVRKWKNHEYYHEKEKTDLHCNVCGAKCKTEYYLKSHMERHGDIKHFCDHEGCGKGFAVKHDVKIHKLRAHSTALNYICDVCGTAFRTWNYRRYHQETVHGLVKQTRTNSKPPSRRTKEPKVIVQQRDQHQQEIIIQQQMTPISIGSSPSYSQQTQETQLFHYPHPYQPHIVSQIFK